MKRHAKPRLSFSEVRLPCDRLPNGKVRGALANEKGRVNERRVVEAINSAAKRSWLGAARLATPEEDARGIDVVVETTVGPLYLQVKSSQLRAEAFLRRKLKNRGVVVVPGGPLRSEDSELRGRALRALEELYAGLLEQRGGVQRDI